MELNSLPPFWQLNAVSGKEVACRVVSSSVMVAWWWCQFQPPRAPDQVHLCRASKASMDLEWGGLVLVWCAFVPRGSQLIDHSPLRQAGLTCSVVLVPAALLDLLVGWCCWHCCCWPPSERRMQRRWPATRKGKDGLTASAEHSDRAACVHLALWRSRIDASGGISTFRALYMLLRLITNCGHNCHHHISSHSGKIQLCRALFLCSTTNNSFCNAFFIGQTTNIKKRTTKGLFVVKKTHGNM